MDIKEHSYSVNVNNKKILIFGPKAPPIGGVSVHIERLSKVYKKNNNILEIFDCTHEIINQTKLSYIIKIFKAINNFRPDIIDYHTSFLKFYVAELFVLSIFKIFFKFKINLIDHDPRYLYKKKYLEKKILNFLIRFVNKQIIIGSLTYQSYVNNKIRIKNDFSVESPFLPPDIENMNDLLKNYPAQLFNFIDSHNYIILMNAFKIGLINKGQDLYGIDISINLIKFLCSNKETASVGLLLLYPSYDEEYFNIIIEKIERLGLKNNIYMLYGNYPLWPLFSKSTIFIRPTLSDGYSVSIEEGLYFGIPVVASDVCQRPKSTILFDVNNEEDFCNKVYSLLSLKKGHINELNFNQCNIMHAKSSP